MARYIAAQQEGMSQVDFLRLFLAAERIAIRASADPIVKDFLDMLDKTDVVMLDHPDTISGVLYLETLGLLNQPGRAQEILNSSF